MADEMEDKIEAAEEVSDVPALLCIIQMCSSKASEEDWEIPAEASLDAFYRLVKGGNYPPMGALAAIFCSLKVWREEEAIVEVALGCIVAICSKGGGYSEETLDGKVDGIDVNLIVDIMQTYQNEATIQEQACLSIKGLAETSDALKQRLLAVEGIGGELKAAEGRITNERNKKYAGQVATALGLLL